METAKVYARDGNISIVQIEGRRYPAVALQGDTFHAIAVFLRPLVNHPDSDVRDAALDALDRLEPALDLYVTVLNDLKLDKPW